MSEPVRQAHLMEEFVYVVYDDLVATKQYSVWLKVECQHFHLGYSWDTKEEAEWYRDMLCIALEKLVNIQEKRKRHFLMTGEKPDGSAAIK